MPDGMAVGMDGDDFDNSLVVKLVKRVVATLILRYYGVLSF